ncbi:MAG: DUF349 domain-containing protein [bacterium]
MLSRWFKRSNRLESADPATRLEAVSALSAEQAADNLETLATLARTDTDTAVRKAAIAHLHDDKQLAALLEDSAVADAAIARVCELVAQGRAGACAGHEKVVAARIATCSADDLESIWPLLTTPQQCAELALKLRDDARDRVLAHPLLTPEEGLSVLHKTARGRDKYCHRHAREKLDQIKQIRATRNEQEQRLEELDSAIHKALKLAPAEPHALLAHRQKLLRLRDMRVELVQALSDLQSQLLAAGGTSNFKAVGADPLADADLSLPDPLDNPFIALSKQWQTLQQRMLAGEDAAVLHEAQQALTTQWLSHADKIPPSADQHATFSSVSRELQDYYRIWQRSDALRNGSLAAPDPLPAQLTFSRHSAEQLQQRRSWLKRWKHTILAVDWPAEQSPPTWLTDAQTQLSQTEKDVERLLAVTAQAGNQMSSLVSQADQALTDGQIEAAVKYIRQARELQKGGISENDAALANLSARLGELRDWQKFATEPKRQELLQAIEQLANNPLAPADQAARLKHLREQWRALGRPGSAEHIAQQQQFDEYADSAFEPCKAYFAEQAQIRQDNLAARVQLCEQLETYLAETDWQNTDIQAAENILRSAREAWHSYRPCERKALKPVELKFEQLQETLHTNIKNVWTANVAAKQAIVEEAQAQADTLADSLDENQINAAIQSAKDLQQQWRSIGRTPRSADQKLWRDFRRACDQIFAQRDVASTAFKQASAEQLQRFDQAITEFEHAAAGSDHSRAALDTYIDNLNTLAEGISLSAGHRQRVERAREQYLAALQTLAKAGVVEQLKAFERWDAEVSSAEAGGVQMEAPHPVFAPRLAGESRAEDWLALTLEAEIAANIPSPEADRSARMALQVELMNAGRRDLGQEDWKVLRNRWCAAGPKDEQAEQLRGRFFAALQTRL